MKGQLWGDLGNDLGQLRHPRQPYVAQSIIYYPNSLFQLHLMQKKCDLFVLESHEPYQKVHSSEQKGDVRGDLGYDLGKSSHLKPLYLTHLIMYYAYSLFSVTHKAKRCDLFVLESREPYRKVHSIEHKRSNLRQP